MNDARAGASPVERHVRPLLDRLRAGCTDWDNTEMVDEAQPMDCLTVGDVRDAVAEIQRLRAALAKIADWDSNWGPFPENNEAWRAMVVVTAREAVPELGPNT